MDAVAAECRAAADVLLDALGRVVTAAHADVAACTTPSVASAVRRAGAIALDVHDPMDLLSLLSPPADGDTAQARWALTSVVCVAAAGVLTRAPPPSTATATAVVCACADSVARGGGPPGWPQPALPPFDVRLPPTVLETDVGAAARTPLVSRLQADPSWCAQRAWADTATDCGDTADAALLWWHATAAALARLAGTALSLHAPPASPPPDVSWSWLVAFAHLEPCMPWSVAWTHGASAAVWTAWLRPATGADADAARSDAGAGVHDVVASVLPVAVPWCRRAMASSKPPAHRFIAAWAVARARFPAFRHDTTGHLLPVAFQLADSTTAYVEWVGMCTLAHLLRQAVPTDVRPHAPIIADVFHRGLASNQDAAHAVLLPMAVSSLPALFGPPPHDAYDTMFTTLTKKFVLQRSAAMHHAYFSAVAQLAYLMQAHFARHLAPCVELVEAAVVTGAFAFVTRAALHCLLVVCVACWPRLVDNPGLASRLRRLVAQTHATAGDLRVHDGGGREAWCTAVEAQAEALGRMVAAVCPDGGDSGGGGAGGGDGSGSGGCGSGGASGGGGADAVVSL